MRFRPSTQRISIHAPRTGRDPERGARDRSWMQFQSTRPVRGATAKQSLLQKGRKISIHAPRTGRDMLVPLTSCACWYFNPRAPYGARRTRAYPRESRTNFNPRAPYGARHRPAYLHRTGRDFNPRAPYGARPPLRPSAHFARQISIHAPRTGRDSTSTTLQLNLIAFQSTRPVRGATVHFRFSLFMRVYFNPRAPYGARPLSAPTRP